MTNEEYHITQDAIIPFSKVACDFDLDGFLQRINIALFECSAVGAPPIVLKACTRLRGIKLMALALQQVQDAYANFERILIEEKLRENGKKVL